MHVLEGEGTDGDISEERESRIFPDPKSGRKNDVISCHALTPDFLIYGTDMGGLVVFFLEDWDSVHEFKHNAGIKDLVAEPNGTKVCIERDLSISLSIVILSYLLVFTLR